MLRSVKRWSIIDKAAQDKIQCSNLKTLQAFARLADSSGVFTLSTFPFTPDQEPRSHFKPGTVFPVECHQGLRGRHWRPNNGWITLLLFGGRFNLKAIFVKNVSEEAGHCEERAANDGASQQERGFFRHFQTDGSVGSSWITELRGTAVLVSKM